MATITLSDALSKQLTTLADANNTSLEFMLADLINQQETTNLARQYEQYETTLNAMADGLIIYDKDGLILDVNQRFLDIYGIKRDGLVGSYNKAYSGWKRYDDQGQPIPHEARPVAKTLATGKAITNMVMQVTRPSQKPIWISVNTQPMKDDDKDEIYAVVTTITDITAYKEKEIQLRQQAQLFDILPDAVITTDNRNIISGWNQGAEAIYGWTAKEAIGKNIFKLIRVKYLAQPREDALAELLENHVWRGDLIQHDKSGDQLYIDLSVSVIFDVSGDVLGAVAINRNITAQKEAEAQLRFQANMLANITEAIIVTDYEGIITNWNKGAEKLYGWTPEEAIGQHLGKFTQVSYLDRTRDEALSAMGSSGFKGEVTQRTKAGKTIRIEASVNPVHDKQGVTSLIGVLRDVTAKRQMQQELRQEHDFLDRIMTVTPTGIVVVNKNGQITFANDSAIAILHIEKSELTSRTYNAPAWKSTDYDGNPIRDEDEPFSIVMRTGKPVHNYEQIIVGEDGERIMLSINAVPTFDDHGVVDGMVANISDVTKQIMAERAQRASEQRFRHLVEHLTVGVILQDANAEIIIINQTATHLLGLTEDQILGKTSFDPSWNVIHEDGSNFPGEEHPVPQAIKTKKPINNVVMGVYRPFYKDRIWLLVNAEPQFDDDGDVKEVICTLADITEYHELEEQLRETVEKEVQLRQVQSNFISNISHEYRTPLAGILSATEMMKRYADKLTPERQTEFLDRIQNHVRHLNSLVDDVLTLNKAEYSGFKFVPEYTDLDNLCKIIIEETGFVDKDDHKIIFTSDNTYNEAFVDPNLIRHMLDNLLNNAVKYSPSQATITFDLKCEHSTLIFTIKDEGIGIPKSDLPNILNNFHRGENVSNISGTGLGLAIVSRAVDAHKGTIAVDSVVGEGATFTIRIPTSIR